MRRWYGPLLILLLCVGSLRLAAAQPTIDKTARAYLGNRQQIGPSATVVDPARGLIYQAFLGSGMLLVLNSADLRLVREWSIPTLGPVSATPHLVLSPSGDRVALLIAGQGQAKVAIWDSAGSPIATATFAYDNRPVRLLMGNRRAFVLRQGLPPLAVEQNSYDVAGAPVVGAAAAVLSADGRTLAYISAGAADRVGLSLLDTETLAVRTTTFDALATASFSFATAGGQLYVASCGGIAQIELVSGTITRSLATEAIGCLTDIVVSPDGLRLMAITFSSGGPTSLVEVDAPSFEITRRFEIEGSIGRLVAAWSQGKVFVTTRDSTTFETVFAGVLDIAAGTLARLPYDVSLSDGSYGFNVTAVALRRYEPRVGSWRVAVFGGVVTQVVRGANGAVYARIGGAIARVLAGATAPNAFFLGGAGMALAGERLYSHDGEHVFVSDVTTGETRTLARLPIARAVQQMVVDPTTDKLALSWVNTSRNAPPQAGLTIIDTTTGVVDTSFVKSGSRIAIALDPATHRLYVATAQPQPAGALPATGDLSALALDSGNLVTLNVPGIGLANVAPVTLAFDAARGLLAVSDGKNLAAHDRAGVQRWRSAVPGAVSAVNGTFWSVAGAGELAVIEPQGGRQVGRASVGYELTELAQAGPVTYGIDGRSGAIVSAQAASGALPFIVEGLGYPVTTLDAGLGYVIFGDSGGQITTIVPDEGTRNRGNRSAFFRVWQRADEPVAGGAASRSWTWGPLPWSVQAEAYRESPGGVRLVEYRDKTRMEVTTPQADSNSAFYVSNGLLVTEMLRGQIQVGDQEFEPHPCSAGPMDFLCPRSTRVAGDQQNNEVAPAYSDMSALTGTVPRAIGQRTGATFMREAATRQFMIGNEAELATEPTTLVEYDAVTGHNIARVFWQYMNQRGPVLEGGRIINALVVDPLYAFGRPLTDPHWIRARIGGASNEQFVLVQLFERRVLTYTPANPDPFKVEMGNVGQHYYLWRYGQTRW